MNIKSVLKEKKYVLSSSVMRVSLQKNLSLEDTFLLIYFCNADCLKFDIAIIKENLPLSESEILTSFNVLMSKNVVSIETHLDDDHRMEEFVSLDPFYESILFDLETLTKEQESTDIFSVFENEFARPISGTEIEIIKAWVEKGFSEELVLGALKEAVYNGVRNLRYIDKILYEWQRKGFKTMNDVENHLRKREEEKKSEEELFDYNWLEDDE